MKKRKPLVEIRNTMEQQGLSLTALSFYTGVDISRLSRIMNGWLIPNQSDKDRINKVFARKIV